MRPRLPRFGRVVVAGRSMLPEYAEGDWLAFSSFRRVRTGDVVVARDPRDLNRVIVKRAVRRVAAGWWLEGDNEQASTDSRTYGAVPPDLILGSVLFRYHRGSPG